ncbi:MAG: UDP-N-acetylglucosamine pyrophosphorylase [Patescibacteria group bacterium]
MNLKTTTLLDLTHTEHAVLFKDKKFPWEILLALKSYVDNLTKGKTDIICGKNVVIDSQARIEGPVVIGDNTTIGFGAYIRPYSVIGRNCIIGHATEVKHCLIFDDVVLPHFNYVGDSVVGYKVHLGGGAVLANFKTDGKNVVIVTETETIDTGLRKFGAVLGDNVEIGSGAILNPGTIIGRNTTIYAGSSIRGCISENSIVKLRQQIEIVPRHQ